MMASSLHVRLAELLDGLAQKIPPDDLVIALSAKWHIPEDDVNVYLSAIASYNIRGSMLRGVQASYDDSYRQVFKELDVLARQGAPCLVHAKPGLLQRLRTRLRRSPSG